LQDIGLSRLDAHAIGKAIEEGQSVSGVFALTYHDTGISDNYSAASLQGNTGLGAEARSLLVEGALAP